MLDYKLFLDSENRYVFEESWNKKTYFYKYLKIDKVEDSNWIITDALKIKSKVIWYKKWYHEFELNTIISDWKRL